MRSWDLIQEERTDILQTAIRSYADQLGHAVIALAKNSVSAHSLSRM